MINERCRFIRPNQWVVPVLAVMLSWFNAAAGELSWQKSKTSVTLQKSGKPLWSLEHSGAKATKPYFHPLATTDGFVVTDLRPSDHAWHMAGWFSMKFINGVNYWEERNGKSEGLTEVLHTDVQTAADFSAVITQSIAYHPPGKPTVLTEFRTVRVSAPDATGRYRIDWFHHFTAEQQVELNRTPLPGEPGGKGHGGYAGSSMRLSKKTLKWQYLDSEGRNKPASIHGHTARWLQFSGAEGAVAMFDHPGNRSYPSDWFIVAGMPYISPAFIFHKPITLTAGSSLSLSYRMLIGTNAMTADAMNAEAAAFGKVEIPIVEEDGDTDRSGRVDLVKLGRHLYSTNCETCHSISQEQEAGRVGPSWWGLAQVPPRRSLVQSKGKVVQALVDDAYLVAALRKPLAHVAIHESGDLKGTAFPPAMPPYPNFSDLDVAGFIAFMKTLNGPQQRGPAEVWVRKPKVVRTGRNPHEIIVRDRPVVQRVIVQKYAPRAFAVGMPGGFNYLFDPTTLSVKHAWVGGFLDLTGERSGRGNRPNGLGAGALAVGFQECLVPIVETGDEVQFLGYRFDKSIAPTIDYRVGEVTIHQRLIFRDMHTIAIRFQTDAKRDLRFRFPPDSGVDISAAGTSRTGDVLTVPARLTADFEIVLRLAPNRLINAVASSLGKKDGGSAGPSGAIDGDPNTYWDETDGQSSYQLAIRLPSAQALDHISLSGFAHHHYAPRDFQVLVDGKVAATVRNATYVNNRLKVPLNGAKGSELTLNITGYYGSSPAIREIEFHTVKEKQQ